jgi:hypothetical protein
MGGIYAKIAGSWARILRASAPRRLTMVALLVTGRDSRDRSRRGLKPPAVSDRKPGMSLELKSFLPNPNLPTREYASGR